MASITSAGVGSGLDIESLVAKLVSAERSATDSRLASKQTKLNSQVSAVGSFKSVLTSLQDKLGALKTSGSLNQLSASSSSAETFTVSATSSAKRGSYQVEVMALAQSHKLASSAFASGASSALGPGDVTLDVGDESFTVTLGAMDTLGSLRDAINAASDNKGVTATIVNESGGARLLLTSDASGADHEITVTSSLLSFTEKQPAQDAHLQIDGYDVYSASNQVSSAIDGVTLNLQKATPGTTNTLNLSFDSKAATSAIQSFVTAYNTAISMMTTLTRYNADTKVAATLNGDAMVRGASQELRQLAGSAFGSGDVKYLSQLGISAQTDGTLKLDIAKLGEVLASDSVAVQKLLSGSGGLSERFDTTLKRLVGDDGLVKSRNDTLQSQLKDISKQQDALDARMTKVEARYRAQYTALDSLLAQMQTTSSYLTQQLAALSSSS